jgi:ribosome-associated protein
MNTRILFLAFALFAATLPACEGLLGKPTKVASGELYESGEARYDGYFKQVHEEQIAAGSWAEESKAAREPLTRALNLTPTASNSTIISAAKNKKGDAAVQSAAEATTSAEIAFAKKQLENSERLEKLATEGVELKKQAVEDRRNMGADKADPDKVEKKEELKREISAAAEVAADLRDDAKKGAKEAEDLAQALKKELGVVGDGAGIVKKDEPGADKDKDDKDDPAPAAKKPAAKKPAKKPAAAPPASEPRPAPKPAPKPTEEVFNP